MISVIRSKQSKIALGMMLIFLVMALIPLFVIAHFNYPCSDDFAFADALYRGISSGSSCKVVVQGAWEEFVQFYTGWQGRYFDNILSNFGFGIAVPQYYFSGAYLVLILFLTASSIFVRRITYRVCKWDSDGSWIFTMLVIAMQVLYVPYPSEGFYWYVGATMYTIAYSLLLLLGIALICFYSCERSGGRFLPGTVATFLTFMIGGSNYATGLLTAELLVLAFLWMLMRKKKCLFLGIVSVEYLICFVYFNALAPSNAGRMGAVESLGVIGSILASLKQGAVFLKEWFRLPVLFFLVAVLVLGAYQVSRMDFSFRLPCLVTVISFGLFCSMMTPPFFAGATWGPGRLINLIYFSYYFLLAGNLLYWTGWASHKYEKFCSFTQKEIKVLPVVLCFLVSLVICLKIYGLQSTNSSSALLSLAKGEAALYLGENEARWEIYEDDAVKNAEVEDFSVKPYVLYHDDITEDETDWRNSAVANFFGKDSVRLVRREE
ncbi:DUF6056 family protein [Lachnospiraceae bacterium 38-10]